jgi:lycopene cyclase domain-containing protein
MEYTVSAAGAAACVILLDRWLGTRVLRRREFWLFLAVMYGFKLIANGYLTWRPIVIYGREHFLGARLGTIPLEDFVYGFALIGLSVVLWEYFRRRHAGPAGRNPAHRADVTGAT